MQKSACAELPEFGGWPVLMSMLPRFGCFPFQMRAGPPLSTLCCKQSCSCVRVCDDDSTHFGCKMMLRKIKRQLSKQERKKERTEKGNKNNIPGWAACTICHHSWIQMANLFFSSVIPRCWIALGSVIYLNILSYTEIRLLMLLIHPSCSWNS